MVLVLGIVKASLKILGIGIGVKKVVLLMSDTYPVKPMNHVYICNLLFFLEAKEQ